MILCQITSQTVLDSYSLPLMDSDFDTGGLHQESNVRPNRLFTADSVIILYRAGVLTPSKRQEVTDAIIRIVSQP